MALVKGTITVDENGDATGTGLALRIYNGITGALDADAKAAVGASLKQFCEGFAEAIVDEIQENAVVTVTIETSDSGLQRTPNPNNPDTDTQGPGTEKTLSGTVA